MKLCRARSSPTKREASIKRSFTWTASSERELVRAETCWPTKRLACQCSETRVREKIETQAKRIQLPASDSTTPWVRGSMGRSRGLFTSHDRPGKLSSGQPRPRATTGSTRV
ncbi:hypothetical protein D9M68_597800 [compost metagenome]